MMKEENVNELIKKVEELLQENHALEKTIMQLETEKDKAKSKAQSNALDTGKWFGVCSIATLMLCFICFFVGCFLNGCAASEDHYFFAPEAKIDGIATSFMKVKHIEEYYTGKQNCTYSKYELDDNIIVIDTVGKYNIGDVLCTGKVIFVNDNNTKTKHTTVNLPDTTKNISK